uniref:Clusterin-associated protein 1 n=1 Tax=Parastrongyloides trichosuri TaxID=131310 RepID=A0A0N4ZGJ2_PARTI
MSYRDLRDATEILRSLGFPRVVSIDNFRTPNFGLLAEILEWMIGKFDGDLKMKTNLEHENDRILFIKQCVMIMLQKGRIRMNPKNLYQANGMAIKEIMPALRLLYNPIKSFDNTTSNSVNDEALGRLTEIRSKINANKQEIRRCNILAGEIPQSGAMLYEILSKEVDLKKQRTFVLSQNLNVSEVNRIVKGSLDKKVKEIEELEAKMANISNDEDSLDSKIEKKRREYELLEKRLVKLQSFRPQYIEEYEKLEVKLKGLYSEYVTKFRTLSYLQEQAWEIEKAEKERNIKSETIMRQQVEKLKDEISQLPLSDNEQENTTKREEKSFGNMLGAGLSDDDESEDGSEEDSKEEFKDDGVFITDDDSLNEDNIKFNDIDSEDGF